MLVELIPYLGLVAMIIGIVAGIFAIKRGFKEVRAEGKQPNNPQVNIDLDAVHRALEQIPGKTLQAVISSTNNQKGHIGELMGFMKLNAEYDRVIPLGNIVDFIGIKLPKGDSPGQIDFIDIKTGKAKLSKDQAQLKKLVSDKRINFVKYKIEASSAVEEAESD